MVDRKARAEAAALVERFRDGDIGGNEFDVSFPDSGTDPALHAIHSALCYVFCGDYSDTRLTRDSVSASESDLFDRTSLFLRTDREYEWPRDPWSRNPLATLQKLVTLGLKDTISRRDEEEMMGFGEPAVWPFRNREELQAELHLTRKSQVG